MKDESLKKKPPLFLACTWLQDVCDHVGKVLELWAKGDRGILMLHGLVNHDGHRGVAHRIFFN